MVGSNGAIRESASVGLGVTLISRDAVAAELADGRLVPLPVPGTPMHRDWYLVALADARARCPRAAARLAAHVIAHGGFHAARSMIVVRALPRALRSARSPDGGRRAAGGQADHQGNA